MFFEKILKLSFLSLLLLCFTLSTSVAMADFTDVDRTEIYEDAILYLQENNIVEGYQDGTFGPEKKISRSEMLKILLEAKFLQDDEDVSMIDEYADDNCFDDVPTGVWFTKYVCYAKGLDWVKGYDNGKNFKPYQEVTLVEGLKMSLMSNDIDYDETERWYKGVVDAASEINVIPHNAHYFHYDMRRNQMAELIKRIVEYKKGQLDEYLKDRSDYVVSWDTLKVLDNLLDDVSNECRAPFHQAMSAQVGFEFLDENDSCITINKIYQNRLDTLPEDFNHKFYRDLDDVMTVYYTTNIEDEDLLNELLESFTFYTDDPDNYESLSKSSDYESEYYALFFDNFHRHFVRLQ